MKRIFRNIIPYWKAIILIVLMLMVQAWCDLAMPQYTSNIIDVGIINSGVEHVIPEQITTEEFEMAKLFMTEEERRDWEDAYKQKDEIFVRQLSNETLEKLDEELLLPLIMNNQMSAVEEVSFKEMLAEQTGMDRTMLESLSIEKIGTLLGVELNSFVQDKENADGETSQVVCVDIRPVFKRMVEVGSLDSDSILGMRESMQDTIDTMGTSLVTSMGIAYASRCITEAGMDIEKIQMDYLVTAGLKMIGIALVMGITAVLVVYWSSKVGAGIGRDLREKIFKKVVSFSNAEMDKFSTASLITRSTNDIQQIQMVSIMLLRMIAYAPILAAGGILKVIETGAGMGYVIVLAILALMGYILVLMSAAMPKFKLMQKLVDNMNLVSREILTGLSVIRAFKREDLEEKRFDKANKDLTKTNLFTNRVMNFMMPGMTIIMNVVTIAIVWIAAHKIDAGVMQVGTMTAFITYAMQIVMSFLMLTAISIMLPRAAVAADRIDEVLNTESSILDKKDAIESKANKGVVKFSHVHFRYPGAQADVLSDIDFEAKPGETTAIIGSTGCGKSTLVNLIPRLYDVTEGQITLDGIDIRDMKMKSLRDNIGFVPQKGLLFSGTIASNLRFGKRDATVEELAKAAEIAQASEFIEEKREKYESTIAQGGTNVSGGQKQRLAIARAIAKQPKIYIFDDSFSALDLKTDAALRKALEEHTKDCTTIIVAQRISTILHADQILVLSDGKIVGKGRHEELLKSCEVYREIAKSQLSEKELGLAEEEVIADE